MIMKSNFSIDFLLSSSTATSDKSGDSARTEMETKSLAPIGGDSRGSSYPQQYDLVSWSKLEMGFFSFDQIADPVFKLNICEVQWRRVGQLLNSKYSSSTIGFNCIVSPFYF